MSKAADKRYAGIKGVGERTIKTVADADGVRNEWLTTDRAEIATMIRELASLGRTARWADAVEGWAVAVETESSLEWAFLQFSVWASYAAE